MFPHKGRLFWSVIAIVVVLVALLPALAAYRYTAPSQRNDFVTHPWRGWSFLWTALAVPADSRLKTSGQALREAKRLFRDSPVEPVEVQLLFVAKGKPYSFVHGPPGATTTSTVTPDYRFIWQVTGHVTIDGTETTLVAALLDYASGAALYDVRSELPASTASPVP